MAGALEQKAVGVGVLDGQIVGVGDPDGMSGNLTADQNLFALILRHEIGLYPGAGLLQGDLGLRARGHSANEVQNR